MQKEVRTTTPIKYLEKIEYLKEVNLGGYKNLSKNSTLVLIGDKK